MGLFFQRRLGRVCKVGFGCAWLQSCPPSFSALRLVRPRGSIFSLTLATNLLCKHALIRFAWFFWFLLSLEPVFAFSLSYLKEPKSVFRELGLNESFSLFEKSSGPGDLQGPVIYYRSASWIAVGWQDEKGGPFFVISKDRIIRIYFQDKKDVPIEVQKPDYLNSYYSASNQENPCLPDAARVPSPNPLSLEWHLELIRLSRQACRLVSWIEKTQIYK